MICNKEGVPDDKIKSFYNRETMNVGFTSQLDTNSITTKRLVIKVVKSKT